MSSRLEFSRAVADQTQIVADWAYFLSTTPPPASGRFHELLVERDLTERYLWIAARRARDGGNAHVLFGEVAFWDDNKKVCAFPFLDTFGYTAAQLVGLGLPFGLGTLAGGQPKLTPYPKLDPMLGDNYADVSQVGGGTSQPPLLLCAEDGSSTNVCRMQCFFLRVRAQRVTYDVKLASLNTTTEYPLFTGLALMSMYP